MGFFLLFFLPLRVAAARRWASPGIRPDAPGGPHYSDGACRIQLAGNGGEDASVDRVAISDDVVAGGRSRAYEASRGRKHDRKASGAAARGCEIKCGRIAEAHGRVGHSRIEVKNVAAGHP